MKIRNLTSRPQELKIVEIVGGREYAIYVEANGVADVIESCIVEIDKLDTNIFAIVGEERLLPLQENTIDLMENTTIHKLTVPDKEEEVKEEEKETSTLEGKFICDICQAEFASARGLNTHKNKAHPGEGKE